MIQEKHRENSLNALHWAFVACRSMVYRKAPYEELAKVLDALEILPIWIDCERDMTEMFRETLEDLQPHASEFSMALRAFSGELADISDARRSPGTP